MSDVDWVILACIAISAFLSFLRGFMREALSLVTWLAAILITLIFTSRFATVLPLEQVQSPLAKATISAVILFAGTLVAGSLVNWLLTQLISSDTRGFTDRLIGIIFGVFRGALLVTLLVLVANLAPELKNERWWQNSTLLPRFQHAAGFLHSRLPASIAQHFDLNEAGI